MTHSAIDDRPILATASMSGDIMLWDLDEKKLVFTMKDAHDASVQSVQFLNGKPILLTTGADNSLKVGHFVSYR